MKKPKPVKKRTNYTLRLNSPISFHVPTLDESEVVTQVEQVTEQTYVAQGMTVGLGEGTGGGMGRGSGTGGWPGGDKNGRIQFIRIQYDGEGWDDGMDDASGADLNFLRELRRLSGLPVATRGEAETIRKMTSRRKGEQAPFVFMTGRRGGNISAADKQLLRRYLLDGGMIFADCSSPEWDRWFRKLVSEMFPDKQFFAIADDDPIFRMPFVFPNGAPPLWHHGGMRAMGLRIDNRLAIFYHPGDIHDAWKTGRSGMDAEMAQRAMQMGVNIIYYAFTNYLELTGKAPKAAK